MAATSPWKPLFWERVDAAYRSSRFVRDLLATPLQEISTPMRTADAARGLALIELAQEKLLHASSALGFGLMLELLALRHLGSEDAVEHRALASIPAARPRAGAEYDCVGRSRGHLGTAGRLLGYSAIPGVDDYVDAERLAAVADLEAALQEPVAIHAMACTARGAAAGN